MIVDGVKAYHLTSVEGISRTVWIHCITKTRLNKNSWYIEIPRSTPFPAQALQAKIASGNARIALQGEVNRSHEHNA